MYMIQYRICAAQLVGHCQCVITCPQFFHHFEGVACTPFISIGRIATSDTNTYYSGAVTHTHRVSQQVCFYFGKGLCAQVYRITYCVAIAINDAIRIYRWTQVSGYIAYGVLPGRKIGNAYLYRFGTTDGPNGDAATACLAGRGYIIYLRLKRRGYRETYCILAAVYICQCYAIIARAQTCFLLPIASITPKNGIRLTSPYCQNSCLPKGVTGA